MSKTQNSNRLRQLLQRGPCKTSFLLKELGVSQPTFSRLWSTLREGVELGASKARQYALRRHIAGVEIPIPIFRVASTGRVEPIGYLDVLQGGYYALTPLQGSNYAVYQGIPFFLRDLRPQGFLGRMEPGKHRDLDLPSNILHWSDEQVLKYVSRRSEHAGGDLVLGNESYTRLIAATMSNEVSVLSADERSVSYPDMAENSMQGSAPGSSAGGEQPKFTAVIRREHEIEQIEHVIVKFSPRVTSSSGRRWGDLLVCEHLALEVLAHHNIAAARTSILELDGRVFLEVNRFDRVGSTGRRPMATFSALDGDLGMMDQNWTAVARELGRLGRLPVEDIVTVEILDLFGSLIGNTDKHHGNIAVEWSFEGKHRLLDAYDMLPMLYRPNTHGEVIDREWTPIYLGRVELRHLEKCYEMAHQFWVAVLGDGRISEDFKTIATRHQAALSKLNATV